MGLILTALTVDHRQGDPDSPTLGLRYDECRPVPVPEWAKGTTCDVPVAFIRDRRLRPC